MCCAIYIIIQRNEQRTRRTGRYSLSAHRMVIYIFALYKFLLLIYVNTSVLHFGRRRGKYCNRSKRIQMDRSDSDSNFEPDDSMVILELVPSTRGMFVVLSQTYPRAIKWIDMIYLRLKCTGN